MPRKYTLQRRAARQEDTRRRIVEAAVALHTTIGPARTSVSAVAERAGVQRHTLYRHFPDERALSLECSGLFFERNPLPDVDVWRDIADPERRLRHGLKQLYGYYDRHADEMSPIVRDAETHALTREFAELRMGPFFARVIEVLAEPFRARGERRRRLHAVLALFVDFKAWRLLARAMSHKEAAEAAVRALRCQ